MGSILKFNDVNRTYQTPGGPVEALKDISITFAPRSFNIVTGPSGSGKSTLLNLASLLDKPTSGCLEFLDRDTSLLNEKALSKLRSEHIGMVFQSFHLMPSLTVLENILFRFRYINATSVNIMESALSAARRTGISHLLQQSARLLSGGEMQRVAIARAIVCSPELLVADEPTGNLDSVNARRVVEQFAELNRSGITILMVTHNHELLRYATHHYETHDGILKQSD